jgi:hypothetical protein
MLALASLLSAQAVVLEAPSIDAVWAGAGGGLHVQCGNRIVHVGGAVTSTAIPEGAVAFDFGPCPAFAFADRFTVARAEGGEALAPKLAFPLPKEASLPPLRCRFFLTDALVSAPDASGVTILDRRTGASARLDAPPRRKRDRGWGLTGEIVDDLVVPHVFGFEHRGKSWFVFGGGRFFSRASGAAVTPLPDVDLKENAPIEGFEHVVPPLFADVDGDGVPDLVRADAAKGDVAVQTGLDGDSQPPPLVILLNGPVLSMDAADVTGDGKSELVIARLPELTPIQQLMILTESKVTATLLAYAPGRPGSSAAAPVATAAVPIGVKVAVADDRRRAEIQDVVAVQSGRVLIARPGRPLRVQDLASGKSVERGVVPEGRWVDPLRPVRAGGKIYAVLAAGGRMRLVELGL